MKNLAKIKAQGELRIIKNCRLLNLKIWIIYKNVIMENQTKESVVDRS